jgi:hypothetical protein
MFAPELSELTKEYGRALPYLEILAEIRRHKLPQTRFDHALRSGNLHIIQYAIRLAEAADTLVWEDRRFAFVLEAGNVECLAYVVAKGCPDRGSAEYSTKSVQCLHYVLKTDSITLRY